MHTMSSQVRGLQRPAPRPSQTSFYGTQTGDVGSTMGFVFDGAQAVSGGGVLEETTITGGFLLVLD
jgi:hypothetical protein